MVTKSIITGKKQLTDRIANNLNQQKIKLNKSEIEAVITELLAETKKSLIKGEKVRFLGYYSLKTTMTKPRVAMNLQTKKKMSISAKRVPKIKFSANFKEAIAKNKR
jgi:DNA-binding protein HU-beta